MLSKNYGFDEEGNTKLDGQTNGKITEDGTFRLLEESIPPGRRTCQTLSTCLICPFAVYSPP